MSSRRRVVLDWLQQRALVPLAARAQELFRTRLAATVVGIRRAMADWPPRQALGRVAGPAHILARVRLRSVERWLLELGTRVLAWLSLAFLAIAVIRWAHVPAYGNWSARSHHSGLVTALFFVAGLLGLGVFWRAWSYLRRQNESPQHPAGVAPIDPGHQLGRAMIKVNHASTVLLVAATLQHLIRGTERIDVRDGYYRHSFTTEWTLPGSAKEDAAETIYLLPLIRLSRGFILDDLRVEDAAGRLLSVCNTQDFAMLVRSLTLTWVKTLAGVGGWSDALEKQVDKFVTNLSADGASASQQVAASQQRLVKSLKDLKQPAEWSKKHGWSDWRESLVDFCAAVASDYILFVPISGRPGDRVTVQHAYSRRNPPISVGLFERFRYLFGLRPRLHQIAISGHLYSQSYHVHFRSPPDQYVYDCDLASASEAEGKSCVVAPNAGAGARDYAHVYIRPNEIPTRLPRGLIQLRFDCREKPPGLLGVVALVALAQALFIWLIGRFYPQFFPAIRGRSPAGVITDVPALLLALPGVAAAWLGAQFTSERIRTTSLDTVLGVFVTGALALATTAAAVTRSAGNHLVGRQLGIHHFAWLLMMLISAVLATDLCTRSVLQGVRFSRRLHRDPETITALV